MRRLDIPDPRRVPESRVPVAHGQYDISNALLTRRFRELHHADRVRSRRIAYLWILIGALATATGVAVYRAIGQKLGYFPSGNVEYVNPDAGVE